MSKTQAKKQALPGVDTTTTAVNQDIFNNEVALPPAEAINAPLGDRPLWRDLLQEIQSSRERDQACENVK